MNEIERQVSRYVDGQMGLAERTAFESRMAADPALRGSADELAGLRALFAPGRAEVGPTPSPGFRARTLAALQSLPVASGDAAAVEVERWARRVIYAAAVLVALAVLGAVALLGRPAGDGRLEASPADVQRAMDALDARIRAAAGTTESDRR